MHAAQVFADRQLPPLSGLYAAFIPTLELRPRSRPRRPRWQLPRPRLPRRRHPLIRNRISTPPRDVIRASTCPISYYFPDQSRRRTVSETVVLELYRVSVVQECFRGVNRSKSDRNTAILRPRVILPTYGNERSNRYFLETVSFLAYLQDPKFHR